MSHRVAIERTATPVPLEELRPLYAAIHQHHTTINTALAGLPPRSAEEAWAGRRQDYRRWLEGGEAFVLVAREGERCVGYAFVAFGAGYHGWASAERIAELKELVVAPEARGGGIGTALMLRLAEELALEGVTELRLNTVAGNDRAVRFYERLGMCVATVTLLARVERGPDGIPHLRSD